MKSCTLAPARRPTAEFSRPPRPSLTSEHCQTNNVASACYFGAPKGRVGW